MMKNKDILILLFFCGIGLILSIVLFSYGIAVKSPFHTAIGGLSLFTNAINSWILAKDLGRSN